MNTFSLVHAEARCTVLFFFLFTCLFDCFCFFLFVRLFALCLCFGGVLFICLVDFVSLFVCLCCLFFLVDVFVCLFVLRLFV